MRDGALPASRPHDHPGMAFDTDVAICLDSLMETLMALLLLAGFVAAIILLKRANDRDRARMAEALGLTLTNNGPAERGTDRVMGNYYQRAIMGGTFEGFPASVWSRTIYRVSRRSGKGRSHQTILSFHPEQPMPSTICIEPARTGTFTALFGSDQPEQPTGDAAFDRLFRVSGSEPAFCARLLSPEMRSRLLGLRETRTGNLPDHALGRLAGDLLMGAFVLECARAQYIMDGTPTGKAATHLVSAAPVLAALVRQVQSARS